MRTSRRLSRAVAAAAALAITGGMVLAAPASAAGETVTGTVLEVEHPHEHPHPHDGAAEHDHAHESDAGTGYVLDTGTAMVRLRATSGLSSGDTVTATPDGEVLRVVPAPVGDPVGDLPSATHRLFVVLAVPAGVTPDRSHTVTAASTAARSAAAYWTAQTGKRRTFVVTKVVAAYRSTFTCADYWGMWSEARAKAGFPGQARDHLVVVLPSNSPGCSAGLGTVGGINTGGYSYSLYNSDRIIAHEVGHNLGLGHSGALWCSGASDVELLPGAVPAGCSISEYGESFDVMGNGYGNLQPRNLERLGLLDGAPTVTGASEARQVTLAPVSHQTSPHRAAKLVDATTGEHYWVEHRVDAGADASTPGFRPTYGVRVFKVYPTGPYRSVALDATPTSPGDRDQVIGVGQTLTTRGGSTITVLGVDAVGATVRLAGPDAPAPTGTPLLTAGAVVTATLPATPVAVGATGVLKAKVVDRIGLPAARVAVRLQAQDATTGLFGWVWLSSGTTNRAGEVSLTVKPTGPGVRYRAFVPAGPVLGAEVASELTGALPVSQPLSASATPSSPVVGAPVVVTVKTPGTSAVDLDVQVRRVGELSWSTVASRPALVSTGVFRTTTTFATAGSWEARAVRRAAGDFAESATKPVRLTVKPVA